MIKSKHYLFEAKIAFLRKHRTFPKRLVVIIDGHVYKGTTSTHRQVGAQKYRKLVRILQACRS